MSDKVPLGMTLGDDEERRTERESSRRRLVNVGMYPVIVTFGAAPRKRPKEFATVFLKAILANRLPSNMSFVTPTRA